MAALRNISIFTDGSSIPNPGKGGWAFLVTDGTKTREFSGFNRDTTNNRMELQAAVEALKFVNRVFRKGTTITLSTDSNYVKDGITKWIDGWKKNNWMSSKKEPVKNQDLWKELDKLNQVHSITWKWVKAHDSSVLNNRVDVLAKAAAVSQMAVGA